MVEFKRILCPVDLSELSLRPLAYAAALARWYDAHLRVLHVVPTFEPMQVQSGALGAPVQFVQPMPREEVLASLRQAVEAAGIDVQGVTLAAEDGETVATIIDRAVIDATDLLVLGTHGRSGFDRFVLGSVTEKLLRKAPCPVLSVPPHAGGTPPAEVVFRRILCPVDFSPSALQALGFALDLARQANGTVTLLHVVEWLTEEQRVSYADFDIGSYRQHLASDAHARLRTLVSDEPRTWCEIRDEVAFGRPHRAILQQAEADDSDLIVMGAQGHGGVALALLGSATEQVVRAATCPVLTVRGVAAKSRPGPPLQSTVV